MLSVLLSVFSTLSQMIWGLIVANHCYAITDIFLLFSCPHQLRLWHLLDFFVHLELAKGSIFLSQYSRRYYFRFLFNLGVSMKETVRPCLYEIPAH